MARTQETRPRAVAVALLLCLGAVSVLRSVFVLAPSPARSQALRQVAAAGAVFGASALPAFAEEAAKEVAKAAAEGGAPKIELGGGFAINLDIPETNIVNIAALIAGLLYLLGPILSESMSTRSKDIQRDIDDAIAKFDEANTRMTEAKKAQSQAMDVVGEINASIEKDKKDLESRLAQRAKDLVAAQEKSTETTIAAYQKIADAKVSTYIKEASVKAAAAKLMNLSSKERSAYTDKMISQI